MSARNIHTAGKNDGTAERVGEGERGTEGGGQGRLSVDDGFDYYIILYYIIYIQRTKLRLYLSRLFKPRPLHKYNPVHHSRLQKNTGKRRKVEMDFLMNLTCTCPPSSSGHIHFCIGVGVWPHQVNYR